VVLIVISFFMMWYPVAFESEALRFLYVILAYIFSRPHHDGDGALQRASGGAADNNERTSLPRSPHGFLRNRVYPLRRAPARECEGLRDQRTGTCQGALFRPFSCLPSILTFLATSSAEEFQGRVPPWNLRETVRTTFIEPFP
jgi:hypothetical protein